MSSKRHILLTPKKHAEWIFFPNKKIKEEIGSEYEDVGLFIDSGEVLNLNAIKPCVVKNGRKVICVEEGRIELKENEWNEWKKPLNESTAIFDIERILEEYSCN